MLNRFITIGRLTRDVELKTTTSGIEVATFNLAVQRNYKNKQGEYDVDFFSCIAYKGTAKILAQYTAKGSQIAIEGALQNRSYEKDGQKHYITEIIVESVQLLSKPATNNAGGNDQIPNMPDRPINSDDLPF